VGAEIVASHVEEEMSSDEFLSRLIGYFVNIMDCAFKSKEEIPPDLFPLAI